MYVDLTCPFLPLPVYPKCPYLDRIVLLSQLLKGKNRDKCDPPLKKVIYGRREERSFLKSSDLVMLAQEFWLPRLKESLVADNNHVVIGHGKSLRSHFLRAAIAVFPALSEKIRIIMSQKICDFNPLGLDTYLAQIYAAPQFCG